MLPTMFTSLESITVSELIEQLHSEAEQRDYDMVSQAEMDVSEKEIASKTEVNTSGTGTLIMSPPKASVITPSITVLVNAALMKRLPF